VYYFIGKTGFTTPTWQGYPAFRVEVPKITSAAPPAIARVGMAFGHTCTATGTPPPTFTVTSGALPGGLTLSNVGVISGSPTAAGTFTGTITASNGFSPDAKQAFRIDANDYRTLAASGAHGTLTGSGIYLLTTPATLAATPAPGYLFTGWTGDATGTANPLAVLMDADKTITATFAPDTNDDDGDGLTNYDEIVEYATNPTLRDTDGDGLTDDWEAGVGRFSVVAGSFTWAQAHADAHAMGGELACFPTAALWSRALKSLGTGATDNFVGLWIGASDAAAEGVWTWVNGEPFSFTNWATSRPSGATGNTLDYAEVSGGGGAEIEKWYDRTASFVRDGYILEIGNSTDPAIADSDGDGLADGQEVNYFHTNPKKADSDGDGFSDGAEVEFGGNPLSGTVVPDFKGRALLDPQAGTVQFSFPSKQGERYTLEGSTNLVEWNPLETGIAGTGGTISRSYPLVAAPARWFRAKKE
jgi:uncharacterized repeat protein (TIGR02543 family)